MTLRYYCDGPGLLGTEPEEEETVGGGVIGVSTRSTMTELSLIIVAWAGISVAQF